MPYTGITFRPIRPEDMDFLRQVYASTRIDELSVLGWSQEQLDEFLNMQFDAQHKYYQEHYSDAVFEIIVLNGRDIGRLYLLKAEDHHNIIDIALLPEFRNKGIGRALMQDILSESASAGKKVLIYVEMNNPALRLYHSLGFRETGKNGAYFSMEWIPDEQEQNLEK